MRIFDFSIVFVMLLVILPVISAQDDMLPDLVIADRADFFPEGIEYDADGDRFLLGSLTEGTIFEVDDDGTVTAFIEDDDLMTSIGIHIDVEGGRLLVANTDPTVLSDPESDGNGMLGIYDLSTGERLHFIDLRDLLPEGKQLANDVTSDTEGNAYVTDSFSPNIYKVDAEGNASVFLENEVLAAQPFGLNGIEYHPDGYLLVAVLGSNSLYMSCSVTSSPPQFISHRSHFVIMWFKKYYCGNEYGRAMDY